MNRDDVLRLAQQAGWYMPRRIDESDGFLNMLERFATLVAAHEREQCAKVCEGKHRTLDSGNHFATIIRARGTL